MTSAKPALLLDYLRSGLSEQTHFGFIKLIGKNGLLASVGDDKETVFYQRSCAKPLQAGLLVDDGIIEYFKLTEKEIAISCASHTGTQEHTKILENYLKKIGCTKNDLLCGYHEPISKQAQNGLILAGEKPDILQNNCSGKHTFMLAYCKKNGLSIKDYDTPSHPLQKNIEKQLKKLCGVKNVLRLTKDGCGVPIWATTLEQLGTGYLNLFTNPKYEKITNAFKKNPYIIGGAERLDSEIINANNNLVAKVGAGGLCVVVNTERQQALVVKTCDAELKARTLITIFALLQLKWLEEKHLKTQTMSKFFDPSIKTLHGEIIGKAVPCFDLSDFAY